MLHKFKKIISIIIFLTVFFAIGIFIANVSDEIIEYFGWPYNLLTNLLLFLILFFLLVLLFFLHIVIHEIGHLIFGLATGYSFVSFRIGWLTLVREDGKFSLKKYNIPGTGGQCLMMPPKMKNGDYPFVIFNMGGVLFNLIFSIGALLLILLINDLNVIPYAILIHFILAGVFASITNGIPMKIAGIANDAHNVRSILNDDEAKRGFYLQLRVNGLQSKGMRIREIDLDMLKLKEGSDISSPLNTGIKLMEHNWYMDNMDFENARICLESLVPHFNKLIPLYVNEINCERIFLELIGDCNKDFIDRLYNKGLEKYIKESKFMLNKTRLLMAYEAIYNEDKKKALEHYNDLKRLYESYPNKGEADMEIMLADWVNVNFLTRNSI